MITAAKNCWSNGTIVRRWKRWHEWSEVSPEQEKNSNSPEDKGIGLSGRCNTRIGSGFNKATPHLVSSPLGTAVLQASWYIKRLCFACERTKIRFGIRVITKKDIGAIVWCNKYLLRRIYKWEFWTRYQIFSIEWIEMVKKLESGDRFPGIHSWFNQK